MSVVHDAMLDDFLRDVWETGVGRLEKRLLLRWCNQEKTSVGLWRNIQERFKEIVEKSGEPVGEGRGEWRLFVSAESEQQQVSFTCLDIADIQRGVGWWSAVDTMTSQTGFKLSHGKPRMR